LHITISGPQDIINNIIEAVGDSVGQSMTQTKKSSHTVIDYSMTFDDQQTGLDFD
jgi:hypothetical protein